MSNEGAIPAGYKALKAILILYMVAAFAYVMYSMITQTGLCGLLMDWQMTQFGAAYDKPTVLAAFLLLSLPTWPLFAYIKHKEVAAGIVPAAPVPPPRAFVWKTILLASLAPALIGGVIYLVVMKIDRDDQQREIYRLNLGRGELPPADAKYVELTGVLRLDYQYQVEEKSGSSSRTDTYVPLTGPDWNPAQPIQYFVDPNFNGYHDPQTDRFTVIPEAGAFPGTFPGKITREGLPTFALKEYERHGLKIASPHYLLDRMNNFEGGKVASAAQSEMYYLIPIIGVAMSGAVLIGGSLGLFIRRLRGR